jgi:hypothetical protein
MFSLPLQEAISSRFYARLLRQYLCAKKKIQSQNVTREKPQEAFLYKKRVHEMLMKSTPG